MKKIIIGQQYQARLQLIQSHDEMPYNWVFLPGGPGLGSESLRPLTQNLRLPGNIWHLDFPGDGSNLTSKDDHYLQYWLASLVEAIESLSSVILVAHSTGAMYAQATPELEKLLYGFVIMDSAPDASWQKAFMAYVGTHPLPEVLRLQKIYEAQPTNENLRQLTVASTPYLVHAAVAKLDLSFFEHLPYNAKACEWSAQHFDQTYNAKWIPTAIPTLIFAGEKDHVTPIDLFKNRETYHRGNILIRTIPNAGHYPWIENPACVQSVFDEYCQLLSS